MQPQEGDLAYLWDMLDGARSVGVFIQHVSFDDYVRNRMVQL